MAQQTQAQYSSQTTSKSQTSQASSYASVNLTNAQIQYAVNYNRKTNQSICKDIQRLVNVTVDGSFGPQTVKGIANWQANNGLEADGCFGPKSKAKANLDGSKPQQPATQPQQPAPKPTTNLLTSTQVNSAVKYNKANNQSRCRDIQKLVNTEVDGSFGPNTVQAIARWQSSNGLEVDGKFGPACRAKAGMDGSAKPADPKPADPKPAEPKPEEPVGGPAVTGDWQEYLRSQGVTDIYTGTDTVSIGSHGNKKAIRTLQGLLNRSLAGTISSSARADSRKITQTLELDGGWGLNTLTHLMYYQLSRGYWSGQVSSDKVGRCDKQMWNDLRSGKGASYNLNASYGYSSGKSLGEVNLETISGYGSKGLIKSGGKQNFINMSQAHQDAGRGKLKISSSFRAMTTQATQSKGIDNSGQIELYALYKVGIGNLASTPGYSNHQHGGALDLSGFSHSWLVNNAKKYKFSGISSEDWHWNYNV